MKKRWAYALLLAVTLTGAALCRLWQRRCAWEAGGLLTSGHPSTYCLLAVAAVAAVGFFLLGRWTAKGRSFESYLAAFSLPHKGLLALYVLAGGLMVAGGVAGLTQWWAQSESLSVSAKAMSLALVPGGMGAALVGWVNSQAQEAKGRFAWPLLLPAYCGCVWLIALYQARATQPTAMAYAPALFGAVCAVIGCCAVAAFSFEKPMGRQVIWLSGVALVALSVEVADSLVALRAAAADGLLAEPAAWSARTVWGQLLVCLGYMLYLAAQTKCLMIRQDAPAQLERWTPPAEDEAQDVENEVSDHEE